MKHWTMPVYKKLSSATLEDGKNQFQGCCFRRESRAHRRAKRKSLSQSHTRIRVPRPPEKELTKIELESRISELPVEKSHSAPPQRHDEPTQERSYTALPETGASSL